MKIAITGHTKGLGLALKNFYEPSNEVIGFSRSNKYNILNYKEIVKMSLDCDVFINNAYYEDYQIRLLEELYNSWKNETKIIVNIGTAQTEFNHKVYNDKDYYRNKLNLKLKFKELSIENKICQLIMIYPSGMNNERSQIGNYLMNLDDIVKSIDYVIKSKYIKEIILHNL